MVSKAPVQKETGTITPFAFERGRDLSEHTAPFEAVFHRVDGKTAIPDGGRPQIVTAWQSQIKSFPNSSDAILTTTGFVEKVPQDCIVLTLQPAKCRAGRFGSAAVNSGRPR